MKAAWKVAVGVALFALAGYLYAIYQSTEYLYMGIPVVPLFTVASYLCVDAVRVLQPYKRMIPFMAFGGAASLAIATPSLGVPLLNSYYGKLLALSSNWFTALLFALAGVHAQVINNYVLTFPNGTALSVGPICGGAYSSVLFVLLSLVMVADLGRGAPRKRIAIALLLGLAGANLANIFRITILSSVMYVYGIDSLGLVHQFAGYLIFLAFMSVFWMLSLRWLAVPESKNRGSLARRHGNESFSGVETH